MRSEVTIARYDFDVVMILIDGAVTQPHLLLRISTASKRTA
jgi:hypothetical protein